jgi:tetratricopeptide (TPR) repeat protein
MNPTVRKIHISHAPADLESALQLSKFLGKDGFLTSGNHLAASQHPKSNSNFFESLSGVRALVILLTPSSLVDEHVKRETNIAIENKIPIYPVNLSGEDELKKLLSSEWRYWLSITQILSCDDAREASRKLRFRIPADTDSRAEVDQTVRELINGSWRTLESLFDQIEISKASHSFLDFQALHGQFDNDVLPGFAESSSRLVSAEETFKVENRFAGKMLFGLFSYLQYFDCHALTVDRSNSCGLKGHEIETLVERYVKFSAISFQYPSAITWFTESQFLWNYQKFIELCPPLLRLENFSTYSEILNLDYQSTYSTPIDYGPEFKEWDHKPELALKAHIFDDLSKYVFYNNVSVLSTENISINDANSALSSIESFLAGSGITSDEFESMASSREEFQMSGYSTLSLFRAYLLRLLGNEDQLRKAVKALNTSDVALLRYFLIRSVSASNGIGKRILEQLWDFFMENYEVESFGDEQNEEFGDYSEERSFTIAEQLYFLADRFSEEGDTDTALDLWARSARGGVLSGLASYTWATLNTGEYDAGIALYEECREVPYNPLNLSEKWNTKGNYLLNILARDDDYLRAINDFNSLILEEGSSSTFVNHMSLTILEFQYGDRHRAIQLYKSIPSEIQVQLEAAYIEEATKAQGWLVSWCAQAVTVIKEISKE